MQAFFLSLLRNLIVAGALALLSALFYRQPRIAEPEPKENDFSPTAREGTEIKELFGTGPVKMIVVAVMDRDTVEIRR